MCGIFGIVTNKLRQELVKPLARAAQSLAHRGPDDEGVEFITACTDDLSVAFAHRRLSILDLSPAGHQPMRDDATGNWITYNGEVFNFRDVRQRLESRGLKFNSESDTEVLLKGYGLLGPEAITDWRGMFAFGFWDAQKRQLTLVRDRLGIKPLYYYHDGESFIFASEVRALLATGLVPRRMSRAAIDSYLAFGSVQQPLTIIENVYAVLPGHVLTLKDGRVSTEAYWQLRNHLSGQVTRDQRELVTEIRELLLESVRLRLVSDVPVGVFLSGGIDSSAVVSMMRQATSSEIRSFSICFNEQDFNEQDYAEQIARQFNTAHQSVFVTGGEALAKLPDALGAMDQPSIDGVNTYLISEAVAQSGLKVAVSGLGGDEVFAGYGFFRTIARDEQLLRQVKNVPLGLRRAAAAAINSVATGPRATKFGALLKSDHLSDHAVQLHRQLFTREQRGELLSLAEMQSKDRPKLEEWTGNRVITSSDSDPINQASALELGGYLSDTLLRDTDSMSMAHGLEVRVPLIDHRLVERMLQVPGEAKLREGRQKWLLVEAAGGLPVEVTDRPKRGFELPFKHWLQGALRERIEDSLHSPRLVENINPHAAQATWRGFQAGNTTWSRVWSLYVLDQWAALNL
ncbi:MAG: asparagine synthase (glutamine-hydrolyzing) [Acidobacteriota bacterium]